MYSVLTRNQGINDPEYLKYYCGCHVKQGALIIAIISIVFNVVLELFCYKIVGNILSAYSIIIMVVIVACALVVYADRQEKAWAYIPYLVMQALGIIICLIAIFTFLVCGIILPQSLIDTLTKEATEQGTLTRDEVRTICFTYTVILIISEAVEIWFWTIVFRAYRYMREILGGPSLGDTVNTVKYAPSLQGVEKSTPPDMAETVKNAQQI
uniref:Uncharacterized protein n=1 Tax=Acrobeloides nanus TaxID=290746 RepID=A0A914D1K3_9BILA